MDTIITASTPAQNKRQAVRALHDDCSLKINNGAWRDSQTKLRRNATPKMNISGV
jgi:hypothetical protein